MDSKIGLIIQLAGVSLITLLTLFLRRSINVVALRHWTNAWLFLSCALFCLRLAFGYQEYSIQLFSFYFLTEYVFGFLLVAGCRSLTKNGNMLVRQELFVLPFILLAFGLPFLSEDINLVLNVHSLIMSGFFAFAFLSLWKTKLKTFGWKVMLVALSLLIVDFCQNFFVFSIRQYVQLEINYLAYNSVIDLVLQILLGFGMVIVLLELVLADAKSANERLKKATQKLEQLAHVDPLTAALNRHAFHGYLKRHGGLGSKMSGCVGFFDVDNLKTVNDEYGHATGDAVIRAVVRSIREVIRAEDLIFRWGGDEFFVILVGLDSQSAYERMMRLETLLTNVLLDGVDVPMNIEVSKAFEDFSDLDELENSIAKADALMYLNKQQRKAANKQLPVSRDREQQIMTQ